MLLDIILFIGLLFWAFPAFVFVSDWYMDFFKGKTLVEVTNKDGSIERHYLSNKEAREFIKTVYRYGTVRKAERVKR